MNIYKEKITAIRIVAVGLSVIVFPFVYVFAVILEALELIKVLVLGFGLFKDIYNAWCRVIIRLVFKKRSYKGKNNGNN